MIDVLTNEVLEAIAAVKGCSPEEVVSSSTMDIFPVSSEICKSEPYQKRERSKRFAEAVKTAKAGDKMPDESIYIGCYNDYDWFTTATDALDAGGKRSAMTYNEAEQYARKLHAHEHSDWELPWGQERGKEDILYALYRCRDVGALAGTFSDDAMVAWYWSCVDDRRLQYPKLAPQRNFINGDYDVLTSRRDPGYVRCVRKQFKKPSIGAANDN